MSDADKSKAQTAKTPLPKPYHDGGSTEAPGDRDGSPVDTDAPPSTDEGGKPVDLPDLGGKID